MSASTVAESATTKPFRSGSVLVRSAGGGPTVGYLGGLLGTPAGAPPLGALGEQFTVVAPNLPGFGGSDPCEDLRGLYDWVVATSEIVDLAGLTGKPMVAGSVGAMLALELAAVRPEAFSSLVLVGSYGLWDDAEPVTDAFATTLSNQRALLTADVASTAAFFEDDPSTSAEELIEVNVDRYHTRTGAAALIWPIPEFGLASRLHRVTCPVTLIWGSEDRIVPPSYAERFRAALPNVVASHRVAGAGHLADWDEPAEVAELVGAALR